MNLPEGYSVKYEPHFTFLYCGAVEVAIFSEIGASEEAIETEAWKHSMFKDWEMFENLTDNSSEEEKDEN